MINQQDLIDYMEGTLSAERRAEVEAALATDPTLRRSCNEQQQLDRALHSLLGDTQARTRIKESVGAVIRGRSEESIKREVLRETVAPARAGWLESCRLAWSVWAQTFKLLATATAAILILFVLWPFAPDRGATSSASIEAPVRVELPSGSRLEHQGAVRSVAGVVRPQQGDILEVGTNAPATLTYADGTTLHLDPGVRLQLAAPTHAGTASGKHLTLLSGFMAADVAPQPNNRPLQIHTPQATATVLGTEFDIIVDANQTQLAVVQGEVKLDTARQTVTIAAGQFTIAEPGVEPAVIQSRNPLLWPFASDSPWNQPVGSAARFTPVRTHSFTSDGPLKQVVRARRPFRGRLTDPVRRLWVNGQERGTLRFRDPSLLPANASEPFVIVQAGSRFAVEIRRINVVANGDLEAGAATRSDLNGAGAAERASLAKPFGFSNLGGLIRSGELENGIPHALAVHLNTARLNPRTAAGHSAVWPADPSASFDPTRSDPQSNLHIGSLLAIPPDVDVTQFGISGPALELARALQDYGAYITGLSQEPFVVLGAANSASAEAIDAAFSRLVPLLRVVLNNTPATPGGGGQPRRPPAPPLPNR